MLDGYKTYISVAAGIIVSALYGMGYIDQQLFTTLLGVVGFSSVAALRDAIKKIMF